MGFSPPSPEPSPRSPRSAGRFAALGRGLAIAGALVAFAPQPAPAAPDAIPGPPLLSASRDAADGPTGSFCRLRQRSGWSDAGFAAAIAAVAIASRRSRPA